MLSNDAFWAILSLGKCAFCIRVCVVLVERRDPTRRYDSHEASEEEDRAVQGSQLSRDLLGFLFEALKLSLSLFFSLPRESELD